METVAVSCNLCSNNDSKKIFTMGKFSICRCPNCQLVFVNPQPTEKALEDYYNNQYAVDFKFYQRQVSQKSRRLLKLMRRFIPQGNLLEIGCSYGCFLKKARQRGWKVKGVEISPVASHFAREEYNLPVITGSIRNTNFTDKEFDSVVMWHVLEHDLDPKGLLEKIYRYLRSNGILALTLPNINSLSARILKGYWLDLIPPAHLYQFSPVTIEKLLQSSGFQIVQLETTRGDSPNIFFTLLQGLKNRVLGNDNLPLHPARVENKNRSSWLKLYRFMNVLTTPFYILCYPLVWIFWKLKMGDEILVLARRVEKI